MLHLCPFCFEHHDLGVETLCTKLFEVGSTEQDEGRAARSLRIPHGYLKNLENGFPTLSAITIGFPNHGKTQYLARLFRLLENANLIWGRTDSFVRPMDDAYTYEWWRNSRREGYIHEPTELDLEQHPFIRPLFFNAQGFPKIGAASILIYDAAGEFFKGQIDADNIKYLQPLKVVDSVWFFYSLVEADNEMYPIIELFDKYQSALDWLGEGLSGKNIVVNYTKADHFISKHTMGVATHITPEVTGYLDSDPLKSIHKQNYQPEPEYSFDYDAYFTGMSDQPGLNDVSESLKEFTRNHVSGGGQLVVTADGIGNLRLRFSITSALGGDVNENRMLDDPNSPRLRLLDPFLWVLEFNRTKRFMAQRTELIVDQLLSKSFALRVLNRLRDVTRIDGLRYLGDSSEAGQLTQQVLRSSLAPGGSEDSSAFGKPVKDFPALIGPIIRKYGSDNRYILVTSRAVLDLDDLKFSTYRDALFMVNYESMMNAWHQSVVWDPDSENQPLIERVRNWLEGQEV